jgi:hypothetical protein
MRRGKGILADARNLTMRMSMRRFARPIALIGFYFRDDYKELVRSTVAAGGGRTFAWDKGEASLTRTPNGGTLLLHEHGKPDVSIPLKRDGG